MDIYKDQIAKMVYEQKKLLEDYTREYRDLCENDGDGEDRLVCCINHDRKTYYRARRVNGRYVRKSLGRDTEAINALARKEFLKVTCCPQVAGMDSDCTGTGLMNRMRKVTICRNEGAL